MRGRRTSKRDAYGQGDPPDPPAAIAPGPHLPQMKELLHHGGIRQSQQEFGDVCGLRGLLLEVLIRVNPVRALLSRLTRSGTRRKGGTDDNPQGDDTGQWLAARKKHLVKEKEFTCHRDQLSKERRDLPLELVEKEYTFEGENGRRTLDEIFEDGASSLSTARHEDESRALMDRLRQDVRRT